MSTVTSLNKKFEFLQSCSYPRYDVSKRICAHIRHLPMDQAIHHLFTQNVRPNLFISRIILSKECEVDVYENLWDSLLPGDLDGQACRSAIHVARRIENSNFLRKVGAHVAAHENCQSQENFYNMIHGLIDAQCFDEAVELLELSHRKNRIQGSELGRLFVDCCRQCHFEFVDRIFSVLKERSLLDADMLYQYMQAAFQAGKHDSAHEEMIGFAMAHPASVDERHFILYMKNYPDFLQVFQAYEVGKAQIQERTSHFYSCALHRANQAANYPSADLIFADAQKSGNADQIIRHIYLAGYGDNPTLKLDFALKVFHPLSHLVIIDDKKGETPKVDLHGFSHGSGMLALHYIRDHRADLWNKPLIIICGQGREERGNYLIFRESLITYIESTWPKAHIDETSKNLGRITVTFSPSKMSKK
jgi:hypothetical protein